MKLKFLVNLTFCFTFSSFAFGQNDSLFVTHEYVGNHIDPSDSSVVFKELYVTFHNVDTLNFEKYSIEIYRGEDEKLISRKSMDISQNTLEMVINNNDVTIMLGFFPPDLEYTLYSRLVDYQGVETQLFTNNVSEDD